ncbi:MAG: VOC family protein [Dehalococcoidia bacterium]
MSNVYPFMSYKDAPAAIEFLCNAFGFEKKAVFANEDGSIAHAELNLGSGIVMLGTEKHSDLKLRSPNGLGFVTQGVYIAIEDTDGHFARAKAAGAQVVMEPTDQDYGSRDYSVRDPEGHLWSFGTYKP